MRARHQVQQAQRAPEQAHQHLRRERRLTPGEGRDKGFQGELPGLPLTADRQGMSREGWAQRRVQLKTLGP